jgi:hypothetical protein
VEAHQDFVPYKIPDKDSDFLCTKWYFDCFGVSPSHTRTQQVIAESLPISIKYAILDTA